MGRPTKLDKSVRLMLTLGPLVQIDENYFAIGTVIDKARPSGDRWVAWAKLNGNDILAWGDAVPSVPLESDPTKQRPRYIHELTHKELDFLLKLTWSAPKPVSLLEQVARAAED